METFAAIITILATGCAVGVAWHRHTRDLFDALLLGMLTTIMGAVVAVTLLWVDVSRPAPAIHYAPASIAPQGMQVF